MARKPDIELLSAPTPNGFKITVMLEELGVPYEYRQIDMINMQHKEEWFLKVNPNGRIPAVIDHSKDNFPLFESGAILVYLAEKYGKFYETGDEKVHLTPDQVKLRRSKVLQWLFFQMSAIGPMQGQANVFFRYAPEKIPFAINRYQNETRRLYEVLDRQLKTSKYIAGDWISIADFAIYPWIKVHEWAGVSLEGLPHLKAWVECVGSRPGVTKGMTVGAVTVSAEETLRIARKMINPSKKIEIFFEMEVEPINIAHLQKKMTYLTLSDPKNYSVEEIKAVQNAVKKLKAQLKLILKINKNKGISDIELERIYASLGITKFKYQTYLLSVHPPSLVVNDGEDCAKQAQLLNKKLSATSVKSDYSILYLQRSNHFLKAHYLLRQYQLFLQSTFELYKIRARKEIRKGNPTTQGITKELTSSKIKSIYQASFAETRKLTSFMNSLRKAHENIQDEEENKIPKGLCQVCQEPQQYYCGDCEKKMKITREWITLSIYGNKLLRVKNKELQLIIENYLPKRNSYLENQINMKNHQTRIENLRRIRDQLKADVEKEEELISSLKENNEKQQRKLLAKEKLCEKRNPEAARQKLAESQKQNIFYWNLLARAKRNKIGELMSILPLIPSPLNAQTILFIQSELPPFGNYSGVDQDVSSAALGNIVLLVRLMSLYLGVSLPYRMKFMGSRSVLWDESSKSAKKYTLTLDGNSSQDFQTALDCLNSNIYYLCSTQGLVFEDGTLASQFHLQNLLNLLNRCPDLGGFLPNTVKIPSYVPAAVMDRKEISKHSGEAREMDQFAASTAYINWGGRDRRIEPEIEEDDFVIVQMGKNGFFLYFSNGIEEQSLQNKLKNIGFTTLVI